MCQTAYLNIIRPSPDAPDIFTIGRKHNRSLPICPGNDRTKFFPLVNDFLRRQSVPVEQPNRNDSILGLDQFPESPAAGSRTAVVSNLEDVRPEQAIISEHASLGLLFSIAGEKRFGVS